MSAFRNLCINIFNNSFPIMIIIIFNLILLSGPVLCPLVMKYKSFLFFFFFVFWLSVFDWNLKNVEIPFSRIFQSGFVSFSIFHHDNSIFFISAYFLLLYNLWATGLNPFNSLIHEITKYTDLQSRLYINKETKSTGICLRIYITNICW